MDNLNIPNDWLYEEIKESCKESEDVKILKKCIKDHTDKGCLTQQESEELYNIIKRRNLR